MYSARAQLHFSATRLREKQKLHEGYIEANKFYRTLVIVRLRRFSIGNRVFLSIIRAQVINIYAVRYAYTGWNKYWGNAKINRWRARQSIFAYNAYQSPAFDYHCDRLFLGSTNRIIDIPLSLIFFFHSSAISVQGHWVTTKARCIFSSVAKYATPRSSTLCAATSNSRGGSCQYKHSET